jgi:flavin reductase (DIM6/NTAB) family NADH-FMN oxidoreductase RutF
MSPVGRARQPRFPYDTRMRHTINDLDARRLLGGSPVALISTAWRGATNVMPAAFVTPLSMDPPLIGVAVHPARHTHDMIKYSEEFALNIPTRELLHHVQYLGSVTGSELNKLELTKLPTFRARRVEAPLLEGCVGWIECGIQDAYRIGDHTLFVGKVVAVQAEKDAFDETWLLADPEERPLHYLGVNRYAILGDVMEARIPQPADIKRDVEAGEAELIDEEEASERREREAQDEDRRSRG